MEMSPPLQEPDSGIVAHEDSPNTSSMEELYIQEYSTPPTYEPFQLSDQMTESLEPPKMEGQETVLEQIDPLL